MMELPTPETDALDRELHNPCVLQDRYSEMMEHAQKLERERDEARKMQAKALRERESTEREVDAMLERAIKAEQERDEAREHLAAIKHYLTKERDDALAQIVQAECRAERFCQERDEARREVDRFREEKDLLPISWDT